MNIDLTQLFPEQQKLDTHIQAQHHVTYISTRSKRLLALLVEIGEMINETKTFKFWSTKPSAAKPIILDEYADGMHFLLSLALDAGSEKKRYEIVPLTLSLTEATLVAFQQVSLLIQTWSIAQVEAAFQAYVNLITLLGFTGEEVIAAYFQKLGVNYTRQQNHY
jgi:dimeric dUTPase (all-alpha-NTP-PPase superfamily)